MTISKESRTKVSQPATDPISLESKKKLAHYGLCAAGLALMLMPTSVKAQAVIDVAQALEPVVEPPIVQEKVAASAVEVKTRGVHWEVPSAEPLPPAATSAVVSQLAMAAAEDIAIAQAAQNEFPLIAVTAPAEPTQPEVVLSETDQPAIVEPAATQLTENSTTLENEPYYSSIPAVEVRELAATPPQLALLPEAAERDDEPREPWIALAATNRAGDRKAPWLARLPAAADSEQVESARRIAWLTQPSQAKRPGDWISLTPLELMNESGESTSNYLASNGDVTTYDVSTLGQVAITPADLRNSDEVAVSVDASQVEFLNPVAGTFLDIPSTSVVLRFPVGASIALLANGQVVDASLVGRTETNSETQLRTQSWYGVSLTPGENILQVISTETGDVLQSVAVTVRGLPAQLVLLPARPIPADGRSTASIQGQLLDDIGNLSRWDSIATLQTSDGRFLGADLDLDQPGFQVEIVRGEFTAELQSSLESHLVQLQANANGFDAFSQIEFDTPQRPTLVSGVIDIRLVARGTDFYDSFRDFLPIDGDNRYELDVDAAVFATGNLGEWLYTGAYNSDRPLNEDCRGESALFRASDSDCTNVYSTYGDDSYLDVVAPSIDSIYLRLERNSPVSSGVDYAMWGDFNTEEFATAAQLFTSTSRQLHGFKANYNFGNLALTGFYADTVAGFQRDAIAPDGTSGFYFTSQRNLVPGSESVFFELEELERPGTVLERQQLARGIDYEIDYDRGTLLFNDPVTRIAVDGFGQLLTRRIITTYQHEDGTDTQILASRLQYNLSREQGRESWLGASYFNEDQGSRDFTLYGADTRIALGETAQLIAEIARSDSGFDNRGFDNNVSGNAYRLEIDGSLGRLNGRAYFRSTDAGFTNIATTSFIPGQTRYGAQLTGQVGQTTSLRAQYDHEDNFGTAPRVITDISELLAGLNNAPGAPLNNSLTTYSLGVSQRLGRSTLEADWIHRDRRDRLTVDNSISSDQIRTRWIAPITDKLTAVVQNELSLSSSEDPIYPSRTLIGLNWEVMPWLNVGLNQIFGDARGSATSLDISGEHTFASDTTVRGRFSTVDGRQLGGVIGLEQGINLAPGLDLDLGYERVFSTLGDETAASTQFSQPYATSAAALGLAGGESYSIGLSYTDNADFQASTRFEHRTSRQGSNTVFDLSALGRVSPELTILGDYRLARTANQSIAGLGTSSLLKLGLAYRDPDDDRFNALLRYEYRLNPNSVPNSATVAGTSTETQAHLFAAEAIYAPNWRWELYGKYALRNSRTAISGTDSGDFSSSSTVQLAQARATYRLGFRWDLVGEARWIGGSDHSEVGFAVESGYYPLPDLRLSAGYSAGATDSDFGENRSAGGFYIGATAKLSGLLSGFGTRPSAPRQQQESVVEVSDETTSEGEAAAIEAVDQVPDIAELIPAAGEASVAETGSANEAADNYPSAIEL